MFWYTPQFTKKKVEIMSWNVKNWDKKLKLRGKLARPMRFKLEIWR